MSSNPPNARKLRLLREETSSWVVAALALVMGAALTAVLASYSVQLNQRQVQQRFELLAVERFSRIQERLDGQVQRLDSLRRFFVYSDEVSQDEFNGFANPMLAWTEAYSWAPRILDSDRGAFEAAALRDGVAGFSVRSLSESGTFVPSPRRDIYYPIRFNQIRLAKPAVLGFDVHGDAVRHETLERARQSASMAASPRLRFVGFQPANSDGVLLAAGVVSRSRSGVIDPAVLDGYVLAAINMQKLMTEGMPTQAQDNLALTLTDLTTTSATTTDVAAQQSPEPFYRSVSVGADSALHVRSELTLADRRYLLDIRPTAVFLNANPSPTNGLVILGALLTLMISTLLYVLMSQRRRALRLVAQSTVQLRQREQQLRGAHGQLRNVLDAATQVAIIATDLEGLITSFNVGAERMLGYSSASACGKLILQQLHLPSELHAYTWDLSRRYGRAVQARNAMLLDAVNEQGQAARDWTLVRQDGSTLLVSMQVSAVINERDEWVGYLAVCLDVTERKRVEEELRTMSITDALTGVYNRRYFQERLRSELLRAERLAGRFSVIMLDIDHFKTINDQFGHAMGDRVLQIVCQRVGRRLRRTDVFCRLGGEEFMILCPDTEPSQAYQLAKELWAELRTAPIEGVGQVTASFGIATWRIGEGSDALLLRADSGAYAAKLAGRDRIEPELI
jgi:diguanylate cyclase (GGDEF)-like protein/PAS domain S-box-containing protein